MVQIWGNILDRPIIHELMWPKYRRIIEEFNKELDTVKVLFAKGLKEGFPIDPHFPPVAGKLMYIHKLRQRLATVMALYEEMGQDETLPNSRITRCEDSIYMVSKYNQMMELMKDEEDRIFAEWVASVPDICQINLPKAMIIRMDDGTLKISINFDPQLTALLREVKYLKMFLDKEGIPQEALELFDRYEELTNSLLNLTRTVEWYNWLRTTTTSVEANLIQDEMAEVDVLIDEIISTLTWEMKDVFDVINNAHEKIKDLYQRVQEAQSNLQKVLNGMDKWALVPLYYRKDNKKDQLLALDDRPDRKHKRYVKIQDSGNDIAVMLNENYGLFFNIKLPDLLGDEEEEVEEEEIKAQPTPVPSNVEATRGGKRKGKGKGKKEKKKKKKKEETVEDSLTPEQLAQIELEAREAEEKEYKRRTKWDEYLNYVDDLFCDMFAKAAMVSIGVFLDETESDMPHAAPLFEVQLELQEPVIVFNPSLDISDPDGFYILIQTLMDDIVIMGEMLPRVAPVPNSLNYRGVIESNPQIIAMIKEVLKRIEEGIEKAIQYGLEFEKYSYLWLDSRDSFLEQFLTYGRILKPEEIELLNIDENAVKKTPPQTAQFKEQLDNYEQLYKTIEAIELEWIANGWLRIDVKPLRQALLNLVCKWSLLFKNHLVEHVKKAIKDLEDFCVECDDILSDIPVEGDYRGLLKVMEYLFKIKDRQYDTDNMFQPLLEIIELLKSYGVEFPEEIHVQLAELPDKWMHTKKIAVNTKQQVAPLQTNQANLVRKRITLFDTRQNLLKDTFKKLPFFRYDCRNPYVQIDEAHKNISDYEKQLTDLEESSSLFEVNLPEFKAVRQVRKELRQLKHLWDYIYIVRSSIDQWKTTPWKKIDVDAMEMECKKFAKEIRTMDKDIRGWDAYIQLEGTVKNMLTSLRAVTELQNPAIRERHWQQLMQTTKVCECIFVRFIH